MKSYEIDFLESKAEKMFTYLRLPMPSMNEADQIIERLMNLGSMLAQSGEYKAASQYRVDEILHGEIGKAIDQAMGDKVSASLLNQYVKSACKEWNYLVNAFDRINSAAAKQMMAIQTCVSYEKAKMNLI